MKPGALTLLVGSLVLSLLAVYMGHHEAAAVYWLAHCYVCMAGHDGGVR